MWATKEKNKLVLMLLALALNSCGVIIMKGISTKVSEVESSSSSSAVSSVTTTTTTTLAGSMFSALGQEFATWNQANLQHYEINSDFDVAGNYYISVPAASPDLHFNEENLTVASSLATFVKFNPDRSIAWTIKLTGSGTAKIRKFVVTSTGDIYLAGTHSAAVLSLVDSGATSHTISNTQSGGFIAKLDSAGLLLWSYDLENDSGVVMESLAYDATNNFIVAAGEATLLGDNAQLAKYVASVVQGTPTDLEDMGQGSTDNYAVRISAAGALSWVRVLGSVDDDAMFADLEHASVAIASDGSVYFQGNGGTSNQGNSANVVVVREDGTAFAGFAALTSNQRLRCFTIKLNPAGTPQWYTRGGEGCRGMAVDASDNLYILSFNHTWVAGGAGFNSMFFDSTESSVALTPFRGTIALDMAKVDSDGLFQWARTLHTPSGTLDWMEGASIMVGSGSVYVTGYYSGAAGLELATMEAVPSVLGSLVFNGSPGGTYDIFAVKMNATTGAKQWMRDLGGTSDTVISIYGNQATRLDSSGNLIVGATTNGVLDIQNEAGTTIATTTANAGAYDGFIAKIKGTDGSVDWLKNAAGSGSDGVRAVAVNPTDDSVAAFISSDSTSVSFDGQTRAGDAAGSFLGILIDP